jgi:hypothetical protein
MSGHPTRPKITTARNEQRKFPFVVQVVVPDGGFGCTLDAINAWHRYSKNTQRRGPPSQLGEREFWSWCFEGLEIAKSFRHRFGGEIVPVTIRGQPDFAASDRPIPNSDCEKQASNLEPEGPSSNRA